MFITHYKLYNPLLVQVHGHYRVIDFGLVRSGKGGRKGEGRAGAGQSVGSGGTAGQVQAEEVREKLFPVVDYVP